MHSVMQAHIICDQHVEEESLWPKGTEKPACGDCHHTLTMKWGSEKPGVEKTKWGE